MQISPDIIEQLRLKYGPEEVLEKAAEILEEERERLERSDGTQGKCETCRECYRWKGGLPLRLAYCPGCGSKLRATTRHKAWPWVEGTKPLSCVEAWVRFFRM